MATPISLEEKKERNSNTSVERLVTEQCIPSAAAQEEQLDSVSVNRKNGMEQVDDVCSMGVRL
jgi:hypothetical protein